MDTKELETRLLNEKKGLEEYMALAKEEIAYRSGRVKMLEELLQKKEEPEALNAPAA